MQEKRGYEAHDFGSLFFWGSNTFDLMISFTHAILILHDL
jgi:hypothetical protein